MIDTEDYNHEYIQQWVISGTTVLSVAPPANRIVATDLTPQDAILIADAPLLLEEVKRLREEVLNFANWLEDKVMPYMTNEMHEVVPIGGMVSDLHKMIKGDD